MSEPTPVLSPSRGSPAVMLVEPEPMLRLTMSKFLRRSGCQVTACPDAHAASAALAQAAVRPSLIVLAARVLDHETVETAQRLRELAPEVPILGVADVVHHVDGETPVLPGGLRFLAPPFDMPDVLRAVRSSLRQPDIDSSTELLGA